MKQKQKEKISISLNRYWKNNSMAKIKLRKLWKGKPKSEATKLKMSISRTGKIRKPRIEKKCINCNNKFYVVPSLNRLQYCCWECYTKSQQRKEIMKLYRQTGHNKGKKMPKTSERMKINNPMFEEENKHYGKDNPMWRGGISFEPYGKNWKSIRKKILKRDYYKCQTCKKTYNDVILNIHHIIPFRITHDNSLNNLITLCPSCHSKITFGSEAQLMKKFIKLEGGDCNEEN